MKRLHYAAFFNQCMQRKNMEIYILSQFIATGILLVAHFAGEIQAN